MNIRLLLILLSVLFVNCSKSTEEKVFPFESVRVARTISEEGTSPEKAQNVLKEMEESVRQGGFANLNFRPRPL